MLAGRLFVPALVVVLALVGLGARAVGILVFGSGRTVAAAPVAPGEPGAPALAGPAPSTSGPVTEPAPTAERRGGSGDGGADDDTRDGGDQPATVKVPSNGSGDFAVVSADRDTERSRGRLLRYDVKMEKDLPFDGAAVSRKVQRVLDDSRSWAGSGSVRFAQVDESGRRDFTVYLATPDTTDELCAPLLTRGEVSCQNGNRVVLNAKRWAFGAKAYGDDVATYQVYLVNHEVGHRLGRGHVGCPRDGARADVMMQQTKGLDGCRANPWPEPNRD